MRSSALLEECIKQMVDKGISFDDIQLFTGSMDMPVVVWTTRGLLLVAYDRNLKREDYYLVNTKMFDWKGVLMENIDAVEHIQLKGERKDGTS